MTAARIAVLDVGKSNVKLSACTEGGHVVDAFHLGDFGAEKAVASLVDLPLPELQKRANTSTKASEGASQ